MNNAIAAAAYTNTNYTNITDINTHNTAAD